MTEENERFPERHPKDLRVGLADLEAIDLDRILNGVKSDEIHFLSFALSDTAKREKEKGNLSTSKVLWLLADVTSMMLNPKDKDDPFAPFMQMVNGTRSAIVEDFTDQDFEFFRESVESLSDYRMKARVADVLWHTGKPTKEFKMVELAIESYMEYPLDQETMLRDGFEAWTRAIFLSKSIGKPGEKYLEKIRARVLEEFWKEDDRTSFVVYRFSDLLFEIIEDRELCNAIAENRERTARDLYGRQEWMSSRDSFEDAIRWYERTGNSFEKMYELRDLVAMAWIEEAEAHMRNDNGLGAGTFFQNAIDELRTIPTTFRHEFDVDTKIRRCRGRLREANLKSIDQMKRIEVGPHDITPLIESAKKHVAKREWPIVLGYFAHVCHSTTKKELVKSAENTMSKSIFRMLASSTRYSTDGRVVAKTPSVNPGDPNDPARLLALEDEMYMHFSIWIGLNVQGSILPALEVLNDEHDITEEKLFELCKHSAIVPVGRERFWAKGLYFGFQKDFMSAIHLLSPQLEHFVRMGLKDHEVLTTTLDSQGLEFEVGMSTLLDKPEADEIFEEDFLNELKMLMSSQRGPNLRNHIAHGLMEEYEVNSDYSIYFWWRMLRMMMDGIMIKRGNGWQLTTG